MVAAEKAPSSSSPACSGKCTTPLVASRAASTCPADTCLFVCVGSWCGSVGWGGLGLWIMKSDLEEVAPGGGYPIYLDVAFMHTCVTRKCSASAAEGRPSRRAISVR